MLLTLLKGYFDMERDKLNKILRKRYGSELVSVEEYREIYEKFRDTIISAEVIPPDFGSNESGYVLIKRENSKQTDFSPEGFKKLLSALADDPKQSEIEFIKLRAKLVYFLKMKGVDKYDVEDTAEEVIFRAARKLSELEEINNVKGYVFSIAKVVLLEYYKRVGRYSVTDDLLLQTTEDLLQDDEKGLEKFSELENLKDALSKLSNDEREMLLRYYDYSEKDVSESRKNLAEDKKISISDLRKQIFRLKVKLRKQFLEPKSV
jgi:RNA polymerase sigma factor (sigma-70 family)